MLKPRFVGIPYKLQMYTFRNEPSRYNGIKTCYCSDEHNSFIPIPVRIVQVYSVYLSSNLHSHCRPIHMGHSMSNQQAADQNFSYSKFVPLSQYYTALQTLKYESIPLNSGMLWEMSSMSKYIEGESWGYWIFFFIFGQNNFVWRYWATSKHQYLSVILNTFTKLENKDIARVRGPK